METERKTKLPASMRMVSGTAQMRTGQKHGIAAEVTTAAMTEREWHKAE